MQQVRKSQFWKNKTILIGGFKRYTCSSPSYIHNPGKEPLRYLTIGKLLKQTATNYGDRPAIICCQEKQQLNFQEVLYQADCLAAGLHSIGLVPGNRVGLWAPNLLEWYVTHMACARAGFVLVNINPAYEAPEMKYCINKVGIKLVICAYQHKGQNYYEMLNEIAPEISKTDPGKTRSNALPTLENIIVFGKEHLRGTFNYEEILHHSKDKDKDIKKIEENQDRIDPDGICHIQFTSGTFGQSKAAVQTHFQIVNNSFYIGRRSELDKKHHKICVLVPFFHAFGTVITIATALNHAATLVVPSPGYNPDKSLDAIRDEKCTVIHGTPTMYVDLVDKQIERNEHIHPEIAVSGGACCSPHLFQQMRNILKLKKVKSVYGLTEATAIVFQSLFDDDEYHSTSTVGYIAEHVEAKVINAQGEIVPRGIPGELCIRGYLTTLGYWKDEEKTKEILSNDGWMKTGDQFILEESGYGKVVGRIKELIIRGGENIFPREIEDILNSHPDILETHVIGLPHHRLGEEVCAVIRTKENILITLEDIKKYCKGKIAYYKIPSVIKIVKNFPKTTSGKIQKFKLTENIENKNKNYL